jgi:hypothetical protein
MGEDDGQKPEASAVSAEGIGMLVAFLDTRRIEHRRPEALHRLAVLRRSDAFDELPEDLRQRIRELVGEP